MTVTNKKKLDRAIKAMVGIPEIEEDTDKLAIMIYSFMGQDVKKMRASAVIEGSDRVVKYMTLIRKIQKRKKELQKKIKG